MKNKTKKRVGIIAMMLMVIVAIGATAGTTLAKYISSATVTDKATVAKWGYTITVNATDLFSQQYNNGSRVSATATDKDVSAVGRTDKLVAPGTSSAGEDNADGKLTFTVNGSAEVDAQLVLDIKEFETVWLKTDKVQTGTDSTGNATYLGAADEVYYPLQWTLTAKYGDNAEMEADLELAYKSDEAFNVQLAKAIQNALAWSKKDVQNADGESYTGPDVLPATAKVEAYNADKPTQVVIDLPYGTNMNNFKLSIAWKWEFQKVKTPAVTEPSESAKPATYYDVEDTVLGWLAAGVNDANATSFDGAKEIKVTNLAALLAETTNKAYNLGAAFGCNLQIVQVQTFQQSPKF